MLFLIQDPFKSNFTLIRLQERSHINLENRVSKATWSSNINLESAPNKWINKDLIIGLIQMCETVIPALACQFGGG